MDNKIGETTNKSLDFKSILAFIIFGVVFFVTNAVINEIADQNKSIEGWMLIAIQAITYVIFIVAMFATILKDVLHRIIWTLKNEHKSVIKTGLKWMAVYLVLSFVLNLGWKALIESATDLEVGSSINQAGIEGVFKASAAGTIIMSLLVMILGPITEEIAFRQGLIGSTSQSDHKGLKRIMIAVSIFMFGAIHVMTAGDWQNIVPYLTMGAILAHVYNKHNDNLTYTIAIHMFANIFSIILLLLK